MVVFSSQIFFSILASVFGVLFRAALENESARFCFYHSIAIAVLAGIYAMFTTEGGTISLSMGKYIGTFMLFFLFGYAASDILNSIVFVIRNPYNPLKIFRKRRKR